MHLMNYQNIEEEHYQQCIPFIDLLLEISNQARKEGLLALEEAFIDKVDFPALNQGLKYVLDGLNPQYVKEIITNFILSSKYQGLDLLKGILTVKFLPLLQNGENPEIIKHILYSCLGFEIFHKYVPADEADLIPEFLSQNAITKNQNQEYPDDTNLLEDTFLTLDDGSIQHVLRNISNTVLAYALLGSSLPVKKRIINNLSIKMANMIIKEANNTNVNIEQILQSQKLILDTLADK